MASFRQQLILSVDLPAKAKQIYVEARKRDPKGIFCLSTSGEELLSDILKSCTFNGVIDENIPDSIDSESGHLVKNVKVSNIRVIKNRSLDPHLLEPTYPERMAFYLYGTIKEQHIDHILLTSPNVQLSAGRISLQFDQEQDLYGPGLEREFQAGLIAVFDDVREAAMQPFNKGHKPDFFKSGKTFRVTIHRDSPKGPVYGLKSSVFARGSITLNDHIFKDYDMINQDITRFDDPSATVSAENIDALQKFVQGQTTASEIAKTAPAVVVPFGGTVVLDRFHRRRRFNDHSRTVAQRSAWKSSWETAVGRRE